MSGRIIRQRVVSTVTKEMLQAPQLFRNMEEIQGAAPGV
jgi:hypothetical protein